ncbi:NADPH-dependent FMN reductase [Waddlia chondrophila 2032/99]|uniref:NADPH-dependent FMN reductase n=2 Tax=Waddlia chondrophila TaxID=71667 RepID=D6YWV6_WADCW|nr:NAD(P)H-dependent oxidoreductase [Waddlia chondrophila]ADI38617.1 NADPH-dependent FMN reductase [Waddlia chondrophila WSU 86-1044]CCB91679.1 NADPH-dependent FMN reductase [Waddlia chondrophila 2032/99]
MNEHPKIIAMAGSMRAGSWNKKLVRIAAAGARKAGAEVTILDLSDYRLPLYDGDLEEAEGVPDKAKALKKLFAEHDGFLFSSPEYNSSISGTFKNMIDWISRPEKGEPSLVAFKGKSAALMSASIGALGGLRGLVHVRAILGNIGVLVLPDQVAISSSQEAFNEDGQLKDPKKLEQTLGLGRQLTELLKKTTID